MEPELSFMDTTYSDIIYFVGPKSSGAYWTIRQFKFDQKGYFKALDTFIVKNIAEEDPNITGKFEKADSFHVSLDSQRRKVFLTNKQTRKMHGTCAYDWLFRPHRVQIEHVSLSTRNVPSRQNQPLPVSLNEINSVSVDHSKIVFTEVVRKADEKYTTKVFVHDKINTSVHPKCILEVPYRAKFGFIQAASLEELNVIKLPKFTATKIRTLNQRLTPSTTQRPPGAPATQIPTSMEREFARDRIVQTTTMRPAWRAPKATTIKLVKDFGRKVPYKTGDSMESSGSAPISGEEVELILPTVPPPKYSTHSPRRTATTTVRPPQNLFGHPSEEEYDNGYHGGGDDPLGLLREHNDRASPQWPSTKQKTTPSTVKTTPVGKSAEASKSKLETDEPSSSVRCCIFSLMFNYHTLAMVIFTYFLPIVIV